MSLCNRRGVLGGLAAFFGLGRGDEYRAEEVQWKLNRRTAWPERYFKPGRMGFCWKHEPYRRLPSQMADVSFLLTEDEVTAMGFFGPDRYDKRGRHVFYLCRHCGVVYAVTKMGAVECLNHTCDRQAQIGKTFCSRSCKEEHFSWCDHIRREDYEEGD